MSHTDSRRSANPANRVRGKVGFWHEAAAAATRRWPPPETSSGTPPAPPAPSRNVSPENADGSELEARYVYRSGIHHQARTVKSPKFSEEQIAYALRQGESGTAVAVGRRQVGVGEATFYV